MDVMKINGTHIAYRLRPGAGRTIVFANSLGSNQSIWDDVVAALPDHYGILTYDLPGHGLSSGTASSIEGLADDLSKLIDALGLTDVLFCGVSIGGMIGQVITSQRPDVICAGVLCNTAPQIGNEERWQTRIKAVEELGLKGIAPEITNTWFGPEHSAQIDRLAMYENMISRNTAAGYIAACEAIQNADLRSFAINIAIPILCIGGTHDRSVPPESVNALAALPQNAKAGILDGIGHLPCLETPQELAKIIHEFDPATGSY